MLLNQWWPRGKVIQIVNNENFNPHHCISGDEGPSDSAPEPEDFNPHHCISGDKNPPRHNPGARNFNPHHCISGDPTTPFFVPLTLISIHTTASVVTGRNHRGKLCFSISIHTTASVVTATGSKRQKTH